MKTELYSRHFKGPIAGGFTIVQQVNVIDLNHVYV